jgi:hypothetical protein
VDTGAPNSKFASMSGHESDYSWITGQLRFVNGNWSIEYAPAGAVDDFGGKLLLVDVKVGDMQPGDLACVSGEVIPASGRTMASYRVRNITVIEHARAKD